MIVSIESRMNTHTNHMHRKMLSEYKTGRNQNFTKMHQRRWCTFVASITLRSSNCLSVFWSWNHWLSFFHSCAAQQSICKRDWKQYQCLWSFFLNWNVVNYNLIQFGSAFHVILHLLFSVGFDWPLDICRLFFASLAASVFFCGVYNVVGFLHRFCTVIWLLSQ